jgi:hypothetical protein
MGLGMPALLALLLNTHLVSRADNETKLANELLRAFMRKVSEVKKDAHLKSPMNS